MKYRRVFINHSEITSDKIVLSDRNARYVNRVLRLKSGDMLKVFDGHYEHLVRLTQCGHTEVCGDIVETTWEDGSNPTEIILAFCCVRPSAMEEILRHGTELGVSRFVPIVSLRSTRKPKEKKQRWETIVAAACAQSGRRELPTIDPPLSLDQFVGKESSEDSNILLSTSSEALPLLHVLSGRDCRRWLLLVGPEGGFSPKEEAETIEAGFVPANLGSSVLRTETAALVATGIVVAWNESRHRNSLSPGHSSDSAEGG
jgi:16S rRNA (uracil1498-N3)-methyltransferase